MSKSEKKAQFIQERPKRMPWAVLAAVLVIAAAVVGWALLPGGGTGVTRLQVVKGAVQIPQWGLDDGSARFYRIEGADGPIDFFLVKSADGVIRAAFDTCDVCYKEKKGYRQEGNNMVCNNCNQAFRIDQINVIKGGCNPAPLQRQLQGDQVVIQLAALEQGSWYFNEQAR